MVTQRCDRGDLRGRQPARWRAGTELRSLGTDSLPAHLVRLADAERRAHPGTPHLHEPPLTVQTGE